MKIRRWKSLPSKYKVIRQSCPDGINLINENFLVGLSQNIAIFEQFCRENGNHYRVDYYKNWGDSRLSLLQTSRTPVARWRSFVHLTRNNKAAHLPGNNGGGIAPNDRA